MSTSAPRANVSLHPVASRHGQQSATLVSVKLPHTDGRQAPNAKDGFREGGRRTGSDYLPSSPTARGASPSFTRSDDSTDSYGSTWGVQHHNIDQYACIDERIARSDQEPYESQKTAPIRALTAAQLAELYKQYVSQDVPHSVVFPFLHGVDGNNAAQNVFFGAPATGQPTPNYRGLAIVRADMPTAEEEERMHQSSGTRSILDSQGRQRAFSAATDKSVNSSVDSTSSSSCDTDEERMYYMQATPVPIHSKDERMAAASATTSEKVGNRPRLMTSSTSSGSVTSSVVSSQQSGPSLFSMSSCDNSMSSQTSIGSMSDMTDASSKGSAKSSSDSNRRRRQATPEYNPQPKHSILNSTVYPAEILTPPTVRRYMYGRYYLDGELSSDDEADADWQRTGPRFIVPAQAPGVSLRNFKIQCAKYATISDIILYCPAGFHEGMLTLAKWFREAQDALLKMRHARGLGGLRYNVFVVSEPFECFERSHPELIAVDSCGFSRNRVDFVEREREEMQRLTAASEIDDNVWLGCTADTSGFSDCNPADDEPITPDETGNPHGFAICIEAHEAGRMPNKPRLSHASHFLDAYEATALFELDSRQALRKLAKDEDSYLEGMPSYSYDDGTAEAERSGTLVLGLNGWSPQPYSCSRSGGLINAPFGEMDWAGNVGSKGGKAQKNRASEQNTPLMPDARSTIHLECASSGHKDDSPQQVDALADSFIQLCSWIKQQASPSSSTSKYTSQASLPGKLRGSRGGSAFYPTSSQRDNRSQSPNATVAPQQPHRPRRVLLHCGDGYTETSVIALAYLMYSRELSLPEAYLDLQERAQRSFFVYARDVPFLKRIEERIAEDRKGRQRQQARERERESENRQGRARHSPSKSYGGNDDREDRYGLRLRRSSISSSSEASGCTTIGQNEQSAWVRGLVAATGLVSSPSGGKLSSGVPSRARTPTPRDDAFSGSAPPASKKPEVDTRWFHDPRFEGSFPSRILPFLYLGNLNHALNAHMLHALDITHVVSVGESAITQPKGGSLTHDGAQHQNSLWYEHSIGRISVLDLKNVSDDGIDPLRDTMREAVEYIEGARRFGGKVLVHCRVGVSRSTTIVLAYVMAHLDLSLVESYLFVRSRRLNILIQPHLLFFWELRGWETFLAKEKARRAKMVDHRGGSSSDTDHTRHCSSEASYGLAALSIRGCSGKSDCSDSFQSVNSSPMAPPMVTTFDLDWEKDEQHPHLDVDLAVGAGTVYGFDVPNAAALPFGSGSQAGIPFSSVRLFWGHFAREISDLNSRYFV